MNLTPEQHQQLTELFEIVRESLSRFELPELETVPTLAEAATKFIDAAVPRILLANIFGPSRATAVETLQIAAALIGTVFQLGDVPAVIAEIRKSVADMKYGVKP